MEWEADNPDGGSTEKRWREGGRQGTSAEVALSAGRPQGWWERSKDCPQNYGSMSMSAQRESSMKRRAPCSEFRRRIQVIAWKLVIIQFSRKAEKWYWEEEVMEDTCLI